MTIKVDGVIYKDVTQEWLPNEEGYVYRITLEDGTEDVVSDLDHDIEIVSEKEKAEEELIACLERLDSKLDKWLQNAAKLLVEDFGKEETVRMFPGLKEYVEEL